MRNNRRLAIAFLASALLSHAQPPPPGGGAGDGIWRRNAYYGESQTFDSCVGHQPGSGDYHYHANPLCLRAQLNDNLVTVASTRVGNRYVESDGPWHHSPILGWMYDGNPIYGPYGYSDAKDTLSPVKRLRSGYRLRNITDRTSLPDWSLANHNGVAQQLSASQYGPAIGGQYPPGRYDEDFEYVNGLGDLDQYNGRFEITPEFPNGTYAYHVAVDDSGNPAFPYLIGGQYYGAVSGGRAQTVPAGVQTYFNVSDATQGQSNSAYLSSWATQGASSAAQVVSGYDPSAGASSTWPTNVPAGVRYSGGVSTATRADVQQVRYSANAVYLNASGLSSATMGPWFDPTMTGGVFSNFPANQNQIQIPVTPAVPTAAKTSTGLGPVGIWVNGVAVFNFLDGGSYSNARQSDQGGGNVFPTAKNYSLASLEQGPFAPGSLVKSTSVFGAVLASAAGDTKVTVKDSAGASRAAQVIQASASEVWYQIPADSSTGFGTVTFAAAGGGAAVTTNINIIASYPNLFSDIDHAPVMATADDGTVTLTVSGSGLGNATDVSATIGGVAATVVSAGASGSAGVDQYVITVPAAVIGQGPQDVVVVSGARPSNTISVTF